MIRFKIAATISLALLLTSMAVPTSANAATVTSAADTAVINAAVTNAAVPESMPAGTIAIPVSMVTADCGTPACAPACVPACGPTITYLHHGRKICCCESPIQMELPVQIPCGCTTTTINIPVCLPGCCTGAPHMVCHWGPLGRGVVRYDFCCGVIVKIIVRPCGDIVVHYIHA